MSNAKGVTIDNQQAQAFLADTLGINAQAVTQIGEGAWSRCFGFRQDEQELAIRFGHYVDDFQKDQLAYRFATPELPIPQVLDIGQAFDGYYAISTRVHGIPLENLNAEQWQAVIPSLVSAMEAMRTADLSSTVGFGGWGEDKNGGQPTWSSHLLRVDEDTPDRRTYGWRKRLATLPAEDALFTGGYDLLTQIVSDEAPRSLLHCDLINRNVLVENGKLSGVFDWGCSLYGDHLYELAWFEFWSSWYPEQSMQLLRSALAQRWQAAGYAPKDQEKRLMACYLHIGLDHLAYNAYQGNWDALLATAERMRVLVGISL